MGGSGGGGWFRRGGSSDDLGSLRRNLEWARGQYLSEAEEQSANGYLGSLLGAYNDRDNDAMSSHLGVLRAAIEREIGEPVELRFGGSVAKRTYVEGMSDVDVLVLLKGNTADNESSQAMQRRFADAIARRLPNSLPPKVGRVAVTMSFSDGMEVQLLPAARHGDGFRIPDGAGGWAAIRPREFSERLTNANKSQRNKLIPAIKLSKALLARQESTAGVKSFHVEALAMSAVQNYSGPSTYLALTRHIIGYASEHITRPIKDPTNQSHHIDGYLGAENSPQRQALSAALRRVNARLGMAEIAGLDSLKALFEE